MGLKSVLRHGKAAWEFQSALPEWREIVFYSEGSGDWPHLGPVVQALTVDMGREVSYLTSSSIDPILSSGHPNVSSFFIGDQGVRTILFAGLKARVVVMTMPELGQTYILRSKAQEVHYVYLFHSLVSTHRVYKRGAFDHYDSVFCCGPHHVSEIRAAERAYGLKPKNLVEHGYPRLDSILNTNRQPRRPPTTPPPDRWEGNPRVGGPLLGTRCDS